MKTNIYTDRFETTLPPEMRKRFGERPPAKYVAPPLRNRTTSTSPWLIAGGITVFIGLAAIAHIMAGFADKADTMRYAPALTSTYTPAPTLTSPSISEATPAPAPQATPTPEATPEIRRAHRIARAHMPDGSSLVVTILGAVSRQEELPLSGNSIGDTYYVAGVPFVWTDLSGGGGWLDPAIEIK